MKDRAKHKPDVSKTDRTSKGSTRNNSKPLPGEYPPQEDIMNRRDTQRVGLDVENFSRAIGPENFNKPDEPLTTDISGILESPVLDDVEDPETSADKEMEWPVPKDLHAHDDSDTGNESDVTQEDLEALGPKDLSMDMGDDEQLKNRVWPVDMSGKDLDIPGAELDDANEDIGSEDEENNSYSLGGDRHEDQLEGK